MQTESSRRALYKTISYRLIQLVGSFIILYIFTGDIEQSMKIGGILEFCKTVVYYFHERLWARLPYGAENGDAPDDDQS